MYPPIAPVIPITIMYLIIASMTENMVDIPYTVNPLSPPRVPIRALPPMATRMMNSIADMIVPNAPASAAFHIPPSIPS